MDRNAAITINTAWQELTLRHAMPAVACAVPHWPANSPSALAAFLAHTLKGTTRGWATRVRFMPCSVSPSVTLLQHQGEGAQLSMLSAAAGTPRLTASFLCVARRRAWRKCHVHTQSPSAAAIKGRRLAVALT